jgi:hypothetical protein
MEPDNSSARTSNPAVTCTGFEILIAVTIFWEVTPCNAVDVHRRFGETFSRYLQVQIPRYVK